MPSRQVRRPLLATGVVGGTLLLAVSGCVTPQLDTLMHTGPAATVEAIPARTPEDLPAEDFVGLDEVPAFYKTAVTEFPFPMPDGTQWPSSVPSGLNDAHGHYETDGLGESIASTYWQCAWEAEFLDAHANGERDRGKDALAMLGLMTTDPYFTELFVDPEQGWKRDVLDPAKRGDVSELKSQHGSCPAFR